MRCFVLLLCIAYAAAGAVHHAYHNRKPTADSDDLKAQRVRIYISEMENSGTSVGGNCQIHETSGSQPRYLWGSSTGRIIAGGYLDRHADPPLEAEAPFEGNYSLTCNSYDTDNADAIFIRKIQYKYNETTCYQARVMNVFDNDDTCNTANMRMNEIRTDCPAGGKIYCVGAGFKYKDNSCQSCRNATADGDSPCGLLHAEDIGDKNSLGYSVAGKTPCPEHQHLCSKPSVSGRAKCCHRKVAIVFKPKIDYIDGSYNWGKK